MSPELNKKFCFRMKIVIHVCLFEIARNKLWRLLRSTISVKLRYCAFLIYFQVAGSQKYGSIIFPPQIWFLDTIVVIGGVRRRYYKPTIDSIFSLACQPAPCFFVVLFCFFAKTGFSNL